MAKPTNREIWQSGVSITDAWLEFASSDDQARYCELASGSTLKQRASETNLETGSDVVKLAMAGLQDWKTLGQLREELQETLLDELFNDQLAAFAYRVSPSRSREPVRIAAELFDDAELDWKNGTISARGCTYSEICVIDLHAMQNWMQSRPGPKGSGDAIRAAIISLQTREVDLCGIPRKEAIELIRAEFGHEHQRGSGLSHVNLAKYLLEFCPKRQIKPQ